MSGVDNEIATAQKAKYQNMYLNAIRNGDWGTAGIALAGYAGVDKAGASMLGAYFPSYKDTWTEGNKRQNAKTNFGYQQLLSRQKSLQDMQKMWAQYQAMSDLDKEKIQYRVGLLVGSGVDPQTAALAVIGKSKTTSSKTSSGTSSATKGDTSWGQKVQSWFNDANEMLTAPEGASPEQIQQAAQNAESTIANMETQINEAIDKGNLTDNEDKTTARNMIADLRYRQAKALGDQDTAAKWFDQMTADYRAKMFPDQRKWTEADQQAAEQEAEQAAAEQVQRDKSSLYAGYATHGSWY